MLSGTLPQRSVQTTASAVCNILWKTLKSIHIELSKQEQQIKEDEKQAGVDQLAPVVKNRWIHKETTNRRFKPEQPQSSTHQDVFVFEALQDDKGWAGCEPRGKQGWCRRSRWDLTKADNSTESPLPRVSHGAAHLCGFLLWYVRRWI